MKPENKITFGKYRGLTFQQAPDNYLRWLSANAEIPGVRQCAQEALRGHSSSEEIKLDEEANRFLRQHGLDPRAFHTPISWRGRR